MALAVPWVMLQVAVQVCLVSGWPALPVALGTVSFAFSWVENTRLDCLPFGSLELLCR